MTGGAGAAGLCLMALALQLLSPLAAQEPGWKSKWQDAGWGGWRRGSWVSWGPGSRPAGLERQDSDHCTSCDSPGRAPPPPQALEPGLCFHVVRPGRWRRSRRSRRLGASRKQPLLSLACLPLALSPSSAFLLGASLSAALPLSPLFSHGPSSPLRLSLIPICRARRSSQLRASRAPCPRGLEGRRSLGTTPRAGRTRVGSGRWWLGGGPLGISGCTLGTSELGGTLLVEIQVRRTHCTDGKLRLTKGKHLSAATPQIEVCADPGNQSSLSSPSGLSQPQFPLV
jgi:hypothetical protein